MNLENTIKNLKSGNEVKIVALGDSLTFGWMVDKGYLTFLKDMLHSKYPGSQIKIINRGIPGDTAEGGLYRLENHVLNEDSDLVIIQFALNDAYQDYPLKKFKNNVLSIIKRIKEKSNAEILLLTSSALQDRSREIINTYYQALTDAAEEEHVQIALVHKYWELKIKEGVEFSTLVQSDYVHPSEAGYRLMAETIAEAI